MAVAVVWLELFRRFARTMIWVSLLAAPVVFIVLGVIFILLLNAAGAAVVCFILAAINAIFIFFIRNRIEFSAKILEIVMPVLQRFPAVTVVSYISILFDIAWMVVWIIGASGVWQAMQRSTYYDYSRGEYVTTGPSEALVGIVRFLLIVSFYWSVVKHDNHITARHDNLLPLSLLSLSFPAA
jgi:hypothetical protein